VHDVADRLRRRHRSDIQTAAARAMAGWRRHHVGRRRLDRDGAMVGAASDAHGRRRIMLIGLAGFVVTYAMLCAFMAIALREPLPALAAFIGLVIGRTLAGPSTPRSQSPASRSSPITRRRTSAPKPLPD
jgi:MFS family permease